MVIENYNLMCVQMEYRAIQQSLVYRTNVILAERRNGCNHFGKIEFRRRVKKGEAINLIFSLEIAIAGTGAWWKEDIVFQWFYPYAFETNLK